MLAQDRVVLTLVEAEFLFSFLQCCLELVFLRQRSVKPTHFIQSSLYICQCYTFCSLEGATLQLQNKYNLVFEVWLQFKSDGFNKK